MSPDAVTQIAAKHSEAIKDLFAHVLAVQSLLIDAHLTDEKHYAETVETFRKQIVAQPSIAGLK